MFKKILSLTCLFTLLWTLSTPLDTYAATAATTAGPATYNPAFNTAQSRKRRKQQKPPKGVWPEADDMAQRSGAATKSNKTKAIKRKPKRKIRRRYPQKAEP